MKNKFRITTLIWLYICWKFGYQRYTVSPDIFAGTPHGEPIIRRNKKDYNFESFCYCKKWEYIRIKMGNEIYLNTTVSQAKNMIF